MEEHQVGITENTTVTTGFNGILKHRYEDFQVFEVDLSGRTAHLTSTKPPEPDEPVPDAQLTEESISELVQAFQEIAGPDNADRLRTLLANIRKLQQQGQPAAAAAAPAADGPAPEAAAGPAPEAGPGSSAEAGQQEAEQPKSDALEVYFLTIKSKDDRKAVHSFLKTDPRLPPLETDTVSAVSGPEAAEAAAAAEAVAAAAEAALPAWKRKIPNPLETHESIAAAKQKEAEALTIIRARFSADVAGLRQKRGAEKLKAPREKRGNKRGRGDWRGHDWAGGDKKHVKFVLLKENMDTQAALTVVGRMLRLHSHAFGFAGTKDRRGVTTQYVTLFKVDPSKLSALNPRLRGIKLGNFEFCDNQLQLGQLKGNAFRILMRDVDPQDEQHIASAVSEVREKGFINYFGLQRFGTGNVPTHRVGAALLRGEWKAAVMLILQGTPHEKSDIRAARDKYTKDGDIKGALDAMPTWMVAERAILQTLLKQGANSYTAALQAVPRTLRSMYMHAWQSYCWNTAASERIRRYGADKVVAGDLVLPPSAAAAGAEDALAAEGEDFAAAGEGDVTAGQVESSSAAARLAAVHVVTAEEAEQGVYSITDVVLPLPGGQVQYPQHAAGWKLYCKLAAEDCIQLPGQTDAEYLAARAAVKAASTAAAAAPDAAAAAAAAGDDGSAAAAASEGAPAAPAAAETPAAADGAAAAAADTPATAEAPPRQHGVVEFQLASLSGDYRRVLHVPSGLQHKVVRYTDPNQPDLLPTDFTELQEQEQQQQHKRVKLDPQQQQQQPEAGTQEQEQQQRDQGQAEGEQQQQLEGLHESPDGMEVDGVQQQQQGDQQPPAAAAAAGNGCPNGGAAAAVAAENPAKTAADAAASAGGGGGTTGSKAAAASSTSSGQQERLGVVLEFSLPSSCYATMLIRELTKSSTSKAAHKELSARQPGPAGA